MISGIKFISLIPGEMPSYETFATTDISVSHTSYASLRSAVARDGLRVVAITQRSLDITDETTYARIKEDKRIAVLYIHRRDDLRSYQRG